MSRRALSWAAGVVVAVNAFVLAGVAWNRQGEPDARMTLTERELPVARSAPRDESSGVALEIDVRHWFPWVRGRPNPDLEWLDARKLAELGFDPAPGRATDGAAELVQRQLPRRCYAVLEYEGRAWDAWESRLAEAIAHLEREASEGKRSAAEAASERKRAEQELRSGSRLFVIDVGRDPSALRARHPDRARTWIVPAKVSILLDAFAPSGCRGAGCGARGSVSLLIDELSVPHRLQAALGAVGALGSASSPERPPRYEVAVRSGKRHEPWIEEIRPATVTSSPAVSRTPPPAVR